MSTYEISFDNDDCKLHFRKNLFCQEKLTFGSEITKFLKSEELIERMGEQIYGLWKIIIDKNIQLEKSIKITLPERKVICGKKAFWYSETDGPKAIFQKIIS